MTLGLSAEERALERRLAAAKRRVRKEAKAARPKKVALLRTAGQRDPREKDAAFLSWIHTEGLTCLACEIRGPVPFTGGNPIEAAHQKLAIAAKGWKGAGKGSRGHDRRCVPLCRWHHQLSPTACDKGQRRFWDFLGLGDGIADVCADLYAAFLGGSPGQPVIARWADEARAASRPLPIDPAEVEA